MIKDNITQSGRPWLLGAGREHSANGINQLMGFQVSQHAEAAVPNRFGTRDPFFHGPGLTQGGAQEGVGARQEAELTPAPLAAGT